VNRSATCCARCASGLNLARAGKLGRLDTIKDPLASYEAEPPDARNLSNRARLLIQLAHLHRIKGHWEKAIEANQECIDLYDGLNDETGRRVVLNNLGKIYRRQRRWPVAEECFMKSLRIKRKRGDPRGDAQTLTNLGATYGLEGRWRPAEESLVQALAIAQTLTDRVN